MFAILSCIKDDPEIGLINVENAQVLDRGSQTEIRSAFLERFLTDPEPFLYSALEPVAAGRRRNDLIIVADHDERRDLGRGPPQLGVVDSSRPAGDVAHAKLVDWQSEAGVPPGQP